MHRSTQPQLGTKLILADGLSGSGKSSLCQWLELQLQRNAIKARWLFEADVPHPLHWWGYWNGQEYCPPDFEQASPAQFIETSIAKWQDFAAATKRSDAEYTIHTLAIETADGEWESYRRQALNALSQSLVADQQRVSASDLARFAGSYWCRHADTELTCAVAVEDGRLMIRSAQPQAVGFFFAGPSRELIPINTHTFYAGISPVVITFVERAAGIREMQVDFSRLGGGRIQVWTSDRDTNEPGG